jgi:hypothetical protein
VVEVGSRGVDAVRGELKDAQDVEDDLVNNHTTYQTNKAPEGDKRGVPAEAGEPNVVYMARHRLFAHDWHVL